MEKNIRLNFYRENELKEEFKSTYMPLNKPVQEIIEMFLEDEDYTLITDSEDIMREKLEKWAEEYIKINRKKMIPNYLELNKMMNKLLIEYKYIYNDAKGIFINELKKNGMEEDEAARIANFIIRDIKEEKFNSKGNNKIDYER